MSLAAPEQRRARMRDSLLGTTVGDCLGERFFTAPSELVSPDGSRWLPQAPWPWTDDTAMAMSVAAELEQRGMIDQNSLFQRFLDVYLREPARGYGPGTHRMMARVVEGDDWRAVAAAQFHGEGSWGNGSAMRVPPLGAYLADDLAAVAAEAAAQATVTHTHPEAVAGAVATAMAAAVMAASRGEAPPAPRDVFEVVISHLDGSVVRDRLEQVSAIPPGTPPADVAALVGAGEQISCPDTVPFVVWMAATHPDDYAEAVWHVAAVGGDRDTTAAMVGGIVAGRTGAGAIPAQWINRAETFPTFPAPGR